MFQKAYEKRTILTGIFLIFLMIGFLVVLQLEKCVLFSSIHGKILLNGKTPVKGASIHRHYVWTYNQKNGEDYVLTNENGAFYFPEISLRSILAMIIPHQKLVKQRVFIVSNNQVYEAFMNDKLSYRADDENFSKREITCSLNSFKIKPKQKVDTNYQLICSWDKSSIL